MFDYQLVDDGGISQIEDVPMLIDVGGVFVCEYGTYKVMEHHINERGNTLPICERISTKTL